MIKKNIFLCYKYEIAMEYDIIIIGGGVVGCAIAREAAGYKLKTALLEKEPDVSEGISKANSGVLHAGFNVKPGTMKARFNVEGLSLCRKAAEELDVEYRECGKLVVGSSDKDLPYLKRLLAQGESNGCSGLSIIDEKRIKELEPRVSGKWALLSESTGVISPFMFTVALAENAADNGVDFFLNSAAVSIDTLSSSAGGYRFTVKTTNGLSFRTKIIINSAGMHAPEIKSLIEKHETPVYPCRGEYYITDKADGGLINMAVYPVPPADGSGLGVHLTPTCNGNILLGPSADYINDPDDTANTGSVMALLKKEAEDLLPELAGTTYIKNYSGMRPKLFKAGSGVTFADFMIEESELFPGMINLMGIESPGLTSAPAIAKYVIEELVGGRMALIPDQDFNPRRQGIIRTARLSSSELNKLCRKDPDYAEIICRCEHISRAEILQAVRNPIGAVSLSAVKKRTYSMMGRCQSGFCLPRIIDIIAAETGIAPEQILKTVPGSEPVKGRLG